MKSRENNDYYMNEDFINEQMNAIIHFANRFNRCKYVVVSDELNDYWKRYWGQYVGFMTNCEYNIKNNKSIEEMGGGAYYHVDNTIYIAVPHNSKEFTLLRTLTHEYGHCIQNTKLYNNSNCDYALLEYHNIWFNENPYNNDILQVFDRIDKATGFRLSSNSPFPLSDVAIKGIKDTFDWGFYSFYDNYKGIIKKGEEYKNKQLLRDIYDSGQVMKQENSLWLPLYYKLFYCFTKGL